MMGRFTSMALGLLMANAASAYLPFAPAQSKNTNNAKYVSSLMRGARPTSNSQLGRRLDGEQPEIDISAYSVKFEKCQFVKAYDDEMAENEEAGTVLGTKRFVIFRLCPNGSCSTCNYNYGEYLVDMETYLEATLQFKQEEQENYCQACEECGQNNGQNNNQNQDEDDGGRKLVNVDCSTCYDECQNIENMEENGYQDAAEFMECQQIYENENNGKQYFAGAMCASSGTRIKIGVFSDEECNTLVENKDAEDYLVDGDGYSMKLSYHLLKQTYSDEDCIADCLVVDEDEDNNNNNNNNNNQQEAETTEMCQQLYEVAAKCEKTHGFDDGLENYYKYNEGLYENQLAQEEVVCDFISSLNSGTYDQSGEIIVASGNRNAQGGAKTTGGQKFALTFFIIGTVGLAVYAAMLHSQLTKGAKADLSRQGGAMA